MSRQFNFNNVINLIRFKVTGITGIGNKLYPPALIR